MAALKGANGGFVATWQDNSFLRGDDTRSGSIVAQRFDNAGNKIGGEILVDTKGIDLRQRRQQRRRAGERRFRGDLAGAVE